jgi:hypothetical protein
MTEIAFWWAIKSTLMLIFWCGAVWFLAWVLAVMFSICLTSWQPRQRRGDHRVGGVLKP